MDENKEELKRKKKEAQVQIKNLKQQQRDNKKEIYRIKEESGQSNPSAVLTIILVVVFLLILLLLIKLDVGGFSSNVLGPAIGDVPYVNQILPKSARQEVSGDAKAKKSDAVTESKEEATTESTTEAATTQAPVKVNTDNSEENPNPDSSSTDVATENTKQMDSTMQVYVDTYTNMEPASAAAILEGMSGDYDLVAQILTNMEAQPRADILAAMSTNNAAKIMKIMESQ